MALPDSLQDDPMNEVKHDLPWFTISGKPAWVGHAGGLLHGAACISVMMPTTIGWT
jgi:hypothetical protein